MESRIRASHEQFSLLIKFMERHGDLSRPVSGVQGRLRCDQLWLELADLLNSVGERGVHKSSDKWKRVWSDWKTKTKKKAALINRNVHGTGRDPNKGKPLTPLEKRILRVMRTTSTTVQEASYDVSLEIRPKLERVSSPVNESELECSPVPASIEEPPPDVQDRIGPADPLSLTTPLLGPSISRTAQGVSPRGASTTHRRPTRQRTHWHGPFVRTTSEFVAIEQSRLRIENERLRLDGERVKLERERIQVESQRIQVEAERIRVEQERIENERMLRETILEFNSNVTSLMLRYAPLFDANLNQ